MQRNAVQFDDDPFCCLNNNLVSLQGVNEETEKKLVEIREGLTKARGDNYELKKKLKEYDEVFLRDSKNPKNSDFEVFLLLNLVE